MSTGRIVQFATEIKRARDLVGLGQSIGAVTFGRVNQSDLYRAGLVQAVAAIDAYVHGVILDRSVDFIMGRLEFTPPSNRIGLTIGAVQALVGATTLSDTERLARGHIATRLQTETYQRSDDIASALAMVGIPRIWSSAFGKGAQTAKQTLDIIVDRRNKIVHQCDSNPSTPGVVTPILVTDAQDAIAQIERIIQTIDALI